MQKKRPGNNFFGHLIQYEGTLHIYHYNVASMVLKYSHIVLSVLGFMFYYFVKIASYSRAQFWTALHIFPPQFTLYCLPPQRSDMGLSISQVEGVILMVTKIKF